MKGASTKVLERIKMTKAEMIETIKQEEEKAWEEMHRFEELFGSESEHTRSKVNYWAGIYDIKRKLGL